MNKSSIFRSILLVISTLFLFASCDKDFNQIGSDVIGDDHFDLVPDNLSTVVAFNMPTGAVQTNNMLINSLGIYDNPVFGKTKANFVTELQMATANPTFDQEKFIELDSVVLSIPYFSTKKSTGANGEGIYELDSIYGSGAISLKVFESGVLLNDLAPPNFQDSQKYYSDDNRFETFKIGNHLNDSQNVIENDKFEPIDKEIITYKRDKGLRINQVDKDISNIEARLTPRVRLHLNTQFFKDKIINAPQGKLINNSVFKEYMKGLYFQVAQFEDNPGKMMQLRFSDGDITLHYREYSELKEDPNNPNGPKIPTKFPDNDPLYPGEKIMSAKTFVLKMGGNCVNLYKNDADPLYSAAMQNPNTTIGDNNLYVKGGEGSMAVIDLFGSVDNYGNDGMTGQPNQVPDELDIIRNSGWLINEANLTFYIDEDKMGKDLPAIQQPREPQRVYLFDLDNNRPLIDFNDGSSISGLPKFNKYVHDGLIKREEVAGGRGIKYRVRITNHIRNLVQEKDSTNVRLGLVVTEYIENIQNAWLRTPSVRPGASINKVPQGSVMNPLGTVLFGTGDNVPLEKRVKLEIYYTKPN
ncbi:DUF4270 domain-containing protein [Flavobacterium sp. PLA-1-15]|uniref:DUF4270 domain-containing protein n=1 Tax=Flavobacterium sp. PLA-1-15 TaxID=3380533 RepID=UPI003B81A492